MMRSFLTADESAACLTDQIIRAIPFYYIRYGDGALECIAGRHGGTCDGEIYSDRLAVDLLLSWRLLMRQYGQLVFAGDWQSASHTSESTRYAQEWEALADGHEPVWINFEALLLNRRSKPLLDLYRAVRKDTRAKLYMGPAGNAGAAKMLDAEHLVTPMGLDTDWADRTAEELSRRQFDVLLYGAGLRGNIPVIRCWEQHPERTYVHLGSALDPLFRGRSRSQQISPKQAREFFHELL